MDLKNFIEKLILHETLTSEELENAFTIITKGSTFIYFLNILLIINIYQFFYS